MLVRYCNLCTKDICLNYLLDDPSPKLIYAFCKHAYCRLRIYTC